MENKITEMNREVSKKYSNKSMVDDFGRVFFYRGRVYRKINDEQKEYCLSLINSELVKELIKKQLIPNSNISSEFGVEDGLVLEHERLIESLQHEWSFSMLRDAALKTIEINDIANKYGYELKDAHTLNVLFKNTNPMFVDIGSFTKKENRKDWAAYSEFLNSFIVPLLFWSENKHYIVRKILESNFYRMFTAPMQIFEHSGLLNLLDKPLRPFVFSLKGKKILSSTKEYGIINHYVKLSNFITRKISGKEINFFKYERSLLNLTELFPAKSIKELIINLPKPTLGSNWDGYHNKFYNNTGSIKYSDRFIRILDIIKNLDNVKSVIDLAGNEGYFSILLANELDLEKIILTDYDENAIDTAYNNIKELKISNITPLLLNFMFTPDLDGTAKRLKSDLVVALAVTHHLILTGKFSLAAIFDRLKMFSNKYVIVEFMPLGLWVIGEKDYPIVPDWYKIEWFREEFDNYFHKLIEEKLEDNRVVFVGELKKANFQ